MRGRALSNMRLGARRGRLHSRCATFQRTLSAPPARQGCNRDDEAQTIRAAASYALALGRRRLWCSVSPELENNSRTNKGDTVDKFYEAIRGDHALLTECEDVTGFKAAYARWRQEKQSNGDIIREPPSTILYRMIRKNLIQELFPGADRNVLVFRGLRGNEANLTNRQRQKRAAERVHSQRGTIEKSSFLTWNDRRWA